MGDSPKPFACNVEGCEMTFTNEDHLNWHHKKHDMALNLGLTNKNAEADQTPTPTRVIRFINNCEEVGLFSVLENVNPFDETFKKAIETGQSGGLHVPNSTNNDDTLHTPHIFPHVEENAIDKYIEHNSDNHSSQSADFCITNVPPIHNQESDEPSEYNLTIITEEVAISNNNEDKCKETSSVHIKDKLKNVIINKAKSPSDNDNNNSSIIITEPFLKKVNSPDNTKRKKSDNTIDNDNAKKQKTNDTSDKEKIREMNRAAQIRCRRRKQLQRTKMEEELKTLKAQNNKLLHENQIFKRKIYDLKELVLEMNKNQTNAPFVQKIEDILNSEDKTDKKTIAPMPLKPVAVKKSTQIIKQLHPVSLPVQAMGTEKPLLIQVMGNVAQLAVSVLPNNINT